MQNDTSITRCAFLSGALAMASVAAVSPAFYVKNAHAAATSDSIPKVYFAPDITPENLKKFYSLE